jgi:hypothetical protein
VNAVHHQQEEEVVTSVRPNALLNPRSEAPPASTRMPISSPPPPLQPPTRASRPSFGMKAAAPAIAPAPPRPIPSAGPPKPPPPVPKKPALPSLPKPSVPRAPVAKPVAPPPEPEPPLVEMSVMPDEPAPEPPPPPAPPPEESPVASAIAEALERGLAESDGALKAAIEASAPPNEMESLALSLNEPATAAPEDEQLPAIPSMPPAVSGVPEKLDLESVEAFSDMPDETREAFAAAATLHELNEGEEIATFALAYVVRGAFEVAATMVDAAAGRLEMGQVLRSRGTTEENVPIRMISTSGSGVVATWSDTSVEEAFRTIPWVEDDLRAAADKMQTLVGITIGPLGERLDMSIREQVVSKLKMRPLIPAEIVVNKGESVPGLLLVGIGELELMKGDEVTGVVGSGEFLFPTEVLGMGDAPFTARAGKGGALVMFGDRGVAQELLVTCPPLLEVFAGM